MRTVWIPFLVAALAMTILGGGVARAVCYETQTHDLMTGSIAPYIPALLRTYEKDVPDGALYTIQKSKGFYFKICNEKGQITHFMQKWVYPEIPDGRWDHLSTQADQSGVDIIKEIGIYRVKKENDNWQVWKYAEKKEEKAKLYVETKPKDALVRLLNIQPKFRQGMELEPGKYLLEVSAPRHEKLEKWLDLRPGEHKEVVALNPDTPVQPDPPEQPDTSEKPDPPEKPKKKDAAAAPGNPKDPVLIKSVTPKISRGLLSRVIAMESAGSGKISVSGQMGLADGKMTITETGSIWFIGQGGVVFDNASLLEGRYYIIDASGGFLPLRDGQVKTS